MIKQFGGLWIDTVVSHAFPVREGKELGTKLWKMDGSEPLIDKALVQMQG